MRVPSRENAEATPVKPMLTVERGLDVLRAFRAERTGLSNAELVRRTGLPKATVSRITTTLVHLGYLRRVPGDRHFELGTGPLRIGYAFLEASPLRRLAQPFMQDLADKLNVSVALAVGDRLNMLYVGYATGRRIATLRLGVGSVLPMMATAIGLAYVWELPAGEQRRLLALARQESGPDKERIDRRVRTAFADLESIGTCFSVSGYQRDAFGIALPIRVGRQRIPMALSCGAVEIESRRDAARTRIAPELKKAAPQLEKILADVEDPV